MTAFEPSFFMQRRKFNLDECLAEAKKYSTRSEFARFGNWAYLSLRHRKLLDTACAHMEISPVYVPAKWTHQAVFDEAAKYRNRAEFKRECSGAHGYALTHGILNQACAHMRDGHNFWHVFELMAVAIKYNRKTAFIKAEPSAYNYCRAHSLTDIVCAHMDQRRDWSSKTAVLTEAARHQSRSAFQALASGAFKQAYAGGYLDEACAHMPPPEYGFSKEKPSVLYQLRITAPGLILFKVGITNREPAARIAGMGLQPGVAAEIITEIRFDSGRDARITEKRLHRKFSSFRYGGPPLMKNGNTELFTVQLLDCD